MSRNMSEMNTLFFENVIEQLDGIESDSVNLECKRYIKTSARDKDWLKDSKIIFSHRFARQSHAVIIEYNKELFVCITNSNAEKDCIVENFECQDLNSGLFTLLGAKKFLDLQKSNRKEAKNSLLYDTSEVENYEGHIMDDIYRLFIDVSCFRVVEPFEKAENDETGVSYFKLLSTLVVQLKHFSHNDYDEDTKKMWERIIFEDFLEKISYKGIVMAYCALTWDITYLYLYQYLEDIFIRHAIKSLHVELGIGISIPEFGKKLYNNLSWQPKDLDSIRAIFNNLNENSSAKSTIECICNGMDVSKWLYTMRNSIVHETREANIPLEDNTKWNKAITGVLRLLIEAQI